MFQVILDMFSAATETTGTTLDWALLFLIAYPEVQEKCFNYIKKVPPPQKKNYKYTDVLFIMPGNTSIDIVCFACRSSGVRIRAATV